MPDSNQDREQKIATPEDIQISEPPRQMAPRVPISDEDQRVVNFTEEEEGVVTIVFERNPDGSLGESVDPSGDCP